MLVKRGKTYHLRIRPFGGKVLITVATPATSKEEAKRIEKTVLSACRAGGYAGLDPVSREVCVNLFRNRGWEIPEDLQPEVKRKPTEALTLWKAIELFVKYPTIRDAKSRERYIVCLEHLVEHWGKDRAIKGLWVPDLRMYQVDRMNEGAAPGTVNWEMATLSKLFGVLIELQLIESNPVRLVKRLSTKLGERQVYISREDFQRIMAQTPAWYQPFMLTAYLTGMRRGELLSITRKQVNLARRIIRLGAHETKEAHVKRVPVHSELVPVLEEVLKVTTLDTDKLFLVRDSRGVRAPGKDTIKNPWARSVDRLQMDPAPHFHDLRHTWKTNARRSGMDPEIRESILGHWFKEKSVTERYGRISDKELVQAIDAMTFDHGVTEIYVAEDKREKPENVAQMSRKTPGQRKRRCRHIA